LANYASEKGDPGEKMRTERPECG